MNKAELKALENLNITLDEIKIKKFDEYVEAFIEENSKHNLISKNDEKFLFAKHIYDSLAINLFLKPKQGMSLLDFGTGGGFPSVPISIHYEDLKVVALDSIKKKIASIDSIKEKLSLSNLSTVCDRVEKIDEQFDFVTSRAVASLDLILQYAAPKLKEGGYFIAYKSKKALDELKAAEKNVKRYKFKLVDIIEYKLPLEEIYERNLIIFKKIK